MPSNLPSLWAEWYPEQPPFVDWLTLHWNQPGLPDFTGEIWQRVDPETGEIKYERKLSRKVYGQFGSARPSIDVSVRDGHVRIDGNPMKFDNWTNFMDGPRGPLVIHSPAVVAQGFIRAVAQHPNVGLPLVCPSPTVTRIDLTKHIPVPRVTSDMREDQSDALRWLGLVSSHRGKAATASSGRDCMGTVYLKASSRLWSLKVYSKGDEVRDQVMDGYVEQVGETADGEPIYDEPTYDQLIDPWLWGTARIELTMRSQELRKLSEVLGFRAGDKDAPGSIFDLDASALDAYWRTYWRRLRMPTTELLPKDELLTTLPRRLRGVYARWKAGEDISRSMSRVTLWRYRKDLMSFGVNIDQPAPKEDQEAKLSTLPLWADRIGKEPGGAHPSGDRAQETMSLSRRLGVS